MAGIPAACRIPHLTSTAMVIAIDGPAGAGKSTVARAAAERLGFTFLDTGAMYRCVGLAAAQTGEPPAAVAERLAIEVGERVLLDGRDVTVAIREPSVSAGASRVAGPHGGGCARGGRPGRAGGAGAQAAGGDGRGRLGGRGPRHRHGGRAGRR